MLLLLLSVMYCPSDLLKINAFKVVAIPRNCEYMRRFGRQTSVSSQFTGDELAPISGNKVDQIYQAELYSMQDNLNSDET